LALSRRSWIPSTIWIMSAVRIERAHLLDRDLRLPRLLLVKNGQADGTRRVHVGVEETVLELAWGRSAD
jgi:hypothetical protein